MNSASWKWTSRIGILLVLATLAGVGCRKPGTVMADTALTEEPGAKKPKLVENGAVKRGEYVTLLETKDVGGDKFSLVQLEGVSTKGWATADSFKPGKLMSVTVIRDADLYQRPSKKAPKAGKAPAGVRAFKLEEAGEFALINYPGKEAYVLKMDLGDAAQVVKTTNIAGLGQATVSASSTWKSTEGAEAAYDVRKLFDGSLQTVWCEGKEADDGLGETVTVAFDGVVTVSELRFVNGHTRSEDRYKANNRVASLRIETDTGGNQKVDLVDENYDYQAVPSTLSGSTFKFIIDGVHKGAVKDTCMSEIKFVGTKGAEGPGGH